MIGWTHGLRKVAEPERIKRMRNGRLDEYAKLMDVVLGAMAGEPQVSEEAEGDSVNEAVVRYGQAMARDNTTEHFSLLTDSSYVVYAVRVPRQLLGRIKELALSAEDKSEMVLAILGAAKDMLPETKLLMMAEMLRAENTTEVGEEEEEEY